MPFLQYTLNLSQFTTKFLRSEWYRTIVEERKDIPGGVTAGPTIPPFTPWQCIKGSFTSKPFDNINVNIHELGGKGGTWVTTTDAPPILPIDPHSLDTKARIKYKGKVAKGLEVFSTAHPKNDVNPEVKATYNYFLDLRPFRIPFRKFSNFAKFVKIDQDLKRTVVGSVELGRNIVPYVHDVQVTENYGILCIWPQLVDFNTMTNGKGFMSQMQWRPDLKSKIYVFDLKKTNSAPIGQFEAPPYFSYHQANAFEDIDEKGGKRIVMDLIGYDSGRIVNGEHGYAYLDQMQTLQGQQKLEREGNLTRFHLPLTSSSLSSPENVNPILLYALDERQENMCYEFPTVNPKFLGRKHRFVYGVSRGKLPILRV